MKKFREKMSERAGFTLVELIVVIAILGILAGAAVAGYSGYIKKANEAADNEILSAVKTAVTATLAQTGTPETITVSSDGKNITAVYDGTTYLMLGTTTETNPVDMKADFAEYMEGNITTTGSGESAASSIKLTSEKYTASGAKWTSTDSKWDAAS